MFQFSLALLVYYKIPASADDASVATSTTASDPEELLSLTNSTDGASDNGTEERSILRLLKGGGYGNR